MRKEKDYQKNYYENNKDRIKEIKKRYRENNKDQIREYQKQYRENNKDKIKDWYDNNKDKIKEYNRNYYKEYYYENKDKIKEYQKRYNENKKSRKFFITSSQIAYKCNITIARVSQYKNSLLKENIDYKKINSKNILYSESAINKILNRQKIYKSKITKKIEKKPINLPGANYRVCESSEINLPYESSLPNDDSLFLRKNDINVEKKKTFSFLSKLKNFFKIK